ncbi:hypothetical protein AAE478_006088 [Parahypoxylon ruwenzoriense]
MDGAADVGALGVDAGVNAESDLNMDLNTLIIDELVGFDSPGRHSSENSDSSSKPYHAKRPHKKSRAGCTQCKKRKVKCDEVRPTCKACRLRKETCVYPSTRTAPSPPSSKSLDASSPGSPHGSSSDEPVSHSMVVAEPLFRPRELTDALDMKMLWFYATQGFQFFSIQSGRSALVDHVLQVKVVQHAFQSPFLMDCLMAVSSLHLQSINQPIPTHRAASYSLRAFKGYRNAIESANPSDFPALIACSLLMIAVSSQMFRDPQGKPLYIIDWMQVWRGIGLIVEIVSPVVLQESGMAVLFYRPPVDLEKATTYIPNNLLFMITSIRPGDADYGHQQTYYDMLKYLGSLYQEIREHGFNPIFNLRIITFFNVWWMRGIADREIRQICKEIGDEWKHLLHVPQAVLRTTDKIEIAKLIINNHNWSPSEKDMYEGNEDPRLKAELRLYNNEGSEVSIFQGQWRRKSSLASIDADLNARLEPCPEFTCEASESASDSS